MYQMTNRTIAAITIRRVPRSRITLPYAVLPAGLVSAKLSSIAIISPLGIGYWVLGIGQQAIRGNFFQRLGITLFVEDRVTPIPNTQYPIPPSLRPAAASRCAGGQTRPWCRCARPV